ncbi:MAG: flavodoxin-dependent (E)-4-hydroxy-3-methylbut-2-enyl-diphosphate synthase [Candidatus Omnitrophica bacterium]|nr:flavodoxin-dependent (E)-4-hydroxy-3-methylbut-2-enyl-diphosphate synthase [Candidatus Omnitrophota bacterium]
MGIKRRFTRLVKIGKVKIGGGYPISIQSMTKTKTSDVKNTVKQIRVLENVGCEIIRVAIKDESDARAIKEIKKEIKIPLESDIHFHYQLAILAIASGSDALRLNPGNIYRLEEIERIVGIAKDKKIPIRVGVNSGSIQNQKSKNKRQRFSLNLSELMVKSALDYIGILEKRKFFDIIVSLKASDILNTIEAYRKMAKFCDYPFHLGITATGLAFEGGIKSALGIGILLSEGIGDTIRVSLAGDPREEVKVARWILSSLGLRKFGPQIIACPTCGRAQIDVIKIAQKLEDNLRFADCELKLKKPWKVAIMGCEVNGPGEARDADLGIAGGKNCAVLFKDGKIVSKIEKHKIIPVLLQEIGKL